MITPTWILPPGLTEDDISQNEGFVYLITNTLTGRMYVGRKYVTISTGRGRKPTSNWRSYWGSCKALTADITALGHDKFTRRILSVHATKAATNYEETAEQFRRDVLKATLPDGTRAYYNGNIMSRYFASSFHSEESRARRAELMKGNTRGEGAEFTPERRQKIAATRRGVVASDETRAKIVAANKARPPMSEETRRKISEALRGRPKTPEHRAKIAANSNDWTPERRAKISVALKGRPKGRPPK